MIVKGNRIDYYHTPFLPYPNKTVLAKGIPSSFFKTAQYSMIPEQNLTEMVSVPEDIVEYLKCEIKSTIQHEGGHRKDEEKRLREKSQGKKVQPFDQFIDNAEPQGEAEEEDCEVLKPSELSQNIISVNLNQLFEEAKSAANINSQYRRDVKAGSLTPDAQGLYNAQDLVVVNPTQNPNAFEGFDGTLWVDVRKIVQPYIVQNHTYSPTTQFDGVTKDIDQVKQDVNKPKDMSVPATPSAPSMPTIPGRASW